MQKKPTQYTNINKETTMEESKFLEATKVNSVTEHEVNLTGSASKPKLDFPFDLNNLFSLQYSFDTLKSAIEWLADKHTHLGERVDALEARPTFDPS